MNSDSKDEIGTVIKESGDKVIVAVDNLVPGKANCDSCRAKIICVPGDEQKRIIAVYNNCQAKVGDKVLISEKENFLIKLAIFQYLIPLLGFSAGIIGFNTIDWKFEFLQKELWLFLGGIIGLIISFFIARYLISQKAGTKMDAIFSIEKITDA
jgi:positive regulator of sigma E activity